MKPELKSMRKKRVNIIAQYSYRILSERIALVLSRTSITPNQVTAISVITSLISGVFFALGTWNYLLLAFLFLQLTVLLDAIDGDLARYTNNCTPLGKWYDDVANKIHKFLFFLGASIGVFRMTGNPIYLILGSITIFNWHFSAYVSETSKDKFTSLKKPSLFNRFESKKQYFAVNLIAINLFGIFVLINKVDLALWFFAVVGLVWLKQIYSVNKQWKKINANTIYKTRKHPPVRSFKKV